MFFDKLNLKTKLSRLKSKKLQYSGKYRLSALALFDCKIIQAHKVKQITQNIGVFYAFKAKCLLTLRTKNVISDLKLSRIALKQNTNRLPGLSRGC